MASKDTDLGALSRALQVMTEDDCDMPMGRALMLIEIANQPGIRMTELEKRLGVSNASTSRNVGMLSEYRRYQEPGLGLVQTIPDPEFPNRKICFLTRKGVKRMARVLSIVLGHDVTLEGHDPAEFVKRAHAGETTT